MDEILERELRQLLDKRAIEECLLRYSRGVDRNDVELIRSAFHPDALENHSREVRGPLEEGFLAWWIPQQPQRQADQHLISNSTIDLEGDIAHVETYYMSVIQLRGEACVTLRGGRYADRFEKRDGAWKIALRIVLPEWDGKAETTMTEAVWARVFRRTRDRSDPTYQRPLQNPPA